MRASIVAVLMFAAAGVADAADLTYVPVKVPPPYPRLYDWTGFYAGANLGGGWSIATSDYSVLPAAPFASVDNSLRGAIGGGQAGYNWQSGVMVLGVETDFQASGMKGGLNAPCPPSLCSGLAATFNEKVPWFGTVRARAGYAADGWLLYVTGGYAYARFETSAFASAGGASASASLAETRSGWTAGVGIEVGLARNWSARLEYLFLDFGTHDRTWVVPTVATVNDATSVSANVARAAVNYRF
jgi:outer membrane immunogenic protein